MAAGRAVSAATGALVIALGATALSGCAPLAAGPASTTASGSGPATFAEVAVTADLYRSRIDPARRGIQLAVHNDGPVALTIVQAVLDSAALTDPLQRHATTTIPPGQTRDLVLILSDPVCTDDGAAPLPHALLTVKLADGNTAEVRVATTDRIGQWAEWHVAECFTSAVAQRAELRVRRAEASDAAGTAGGPGLIGLDLVVVGLADGLELEAVNDTVLFALVGADGQRVASIPIGLTVAPGETLVIPLLLSPARCDAHAIAEDKQGTLFGVDARLGARAGTVTIVADGATRAALYDAFAHACSL